jgi:nitrogen-specific signal transduction histidine kinase
MVSGEGPSKAEILHWASVREILGGFAHEVAQPLNAIMIASQVIQLRVERSLLSDSEKAFVLHRLNIVVSQVERASKLVERFRGFGRGDPGRSEAPDTAHLFHLVYGLMEQQFTVRGIRVVVDRDKVLPVITDDPATIEGSLVQALAFAREAVGAIGQWHESRGMAYERTLLVQLEAQERTQTVRMAWNRGDVPEGTELCDPTARGGLQVASQLVSERGGTLTARDGEVLVTVPV